MPMERINLYLDRQTYDRAHVLLKERGLSASKYINLVLAEYIQVTEGQPMHKRLDEMTLPEFLDLAKYWISEMKEEEKSE